jgi:hypothetical protein
MGMLDSQIAYVEAARERARRTPPPKSSINEEEDYEFYVTIQFKYQVTSSIARGNAPIGNWFPHYENPN